jgi:hypothetical protein
MRAGSIPFRPSPHPLSCSLGPIVLVRASFLEVALGRGCRSRRVRRRERQGNPLAGRPGPGGQRRRCAGGPGVGRRDPEPVSRSESRRGAGDPRRTDRRLRRPPRGHRRAQAERQAEFQSGARTPWPAEVKARVRQCRMFLGDRTRALQVHAARSMYLSLTLAVWRTGGGARGDRARGGTSGPARSGTENGAGSRSDRACSLDRGQLRADPGRDFVPRIWRSRPNRLKVAEVPEVLPQPLPQSAN